MKWLFFTLLTMLTTGLNAQWDGTYYGTVNGDNVVMHLTQNGAAVSGDMKDSYQSYTVSGTVTGNTFSGTAVESVYLLAFGLTGTRQGDVLNFNLIVEMGEERAEVPFSVQKQGATTQTTEAYSVPDAVIPFPTGATFPAALAGSWTKNESYNSGSGDNFMGANFSQTITFHADGTLSEGASSASMSGSNYSGQSSGSGSGKVPGVGWYARQNNLYFIVFQEGKWESVQLGTWYAENNHLLITGTNGKKQLLSR